MAGIRDQVNAVIDTRRTDGLPVTQEQRDALAEEFVLLDNLYCNGHVSADGHPWSTMAYNTDYIARNWALTYSGRSGVDDDDEGDLQKAPSGYLWDACARAVERAAGAERNEEAVRALRERLLSTAVE